VDDTSPFAADIAWKQQYDAEQAAAEAKKNAPPPTPLQVAMTPPPHVDAGMIDTALYNDTPGAHAARDLTSGALNGAANTVDTARIAMSQVPVVGPMLYGPQGVAKPIFDYAKQHIEDFRDAVQVQDPTWADKATQAVGQYTLPFIAFSRGLSALHWLANWTLAGAGADAAATDKDAPRTNTADLIALGNHVQGKYVDALKQIVPGGGGSLVNAFINYVASPPSDEGDAKYKQFLDGILPNAAFSTVLHAGGVVLKEGMASLRYAAENFGSGPIPGSPKGQLGAITYHGSGETNLTQLRPSERLNARGHGIYVSTDKDVAGQYVPTAGGKLYKLNVPDEKIASMLHWDLPLKQQPIAQHIFDKLGINTDGLTAGDAYRALSAKLAPAHGPGHMASVTGFDPTGDRLASQALSAEGVPGIRYAASGKYSTGGSNKENYVVFDHKHVSIIHEPQTEEEPSAAEKMLAANAAASGAAPGPSSTKGER
jgi:hypothetical protein